MKNTAILSLILAFALAALAHDPVEVRMSDGSTFGVAATQPIPPEEQDVTLVVINANGDVLRTLTEGMIFDPSKGDCTIEADAIAEVKSVQFSVDGNVVRTESGRPFVISGDDAGKPRPLQLPAGLHTIKGTASTGQSTSVSIEMKAGPVAPPPASQPSDPAPPLEGFPNATNTGPNNRAILRESGSINVTTAGAVVENVHVKGGSITISADNVTVRNFIVENPDTTGAAVRFASNDIKGGKIEFGEIFGGNATNGVHGSNMTVRRCHIHRMRSDAFRVKTNVTIEECYVHDIGIAPESHADVVQMYPVDGGDMKILRNHFNVPGANAVLFQVEHRWHVEGNLMIGGNFTVYLAGSPEQRFINNVWGKGQYGYIYCGRGERSSLVWEGNKKTDGTPMPTPP